jgi:hypothetical protein
MEEGEEGEGERERGREREIAPTLEPFCRQNDSNGAARLRRRSRPNGSKGGASRWEPPRASDFDSGASALAPGGVSRSTAERLYRAALQSGFTGALQSDFTERLYRAALQSGFTGWKVEGPKRPHARGCSSLSPPHRQPPSPLDAPPEWLQRRSHPAGIPERVCVLNII